MIALLQAYGIPVAIAFMIGVATARWIMPKRATIEEPPVKDLRDL